MDWHQQVEALADAFVTALKGELTRTQWAAMVRDNKTETNPGICHSHDHCDANMVMAAAWEKVIGRAVDVDDDEAEHGDCALWSAAWAKAMPRLGGKK